MAKLTGALMSLGARGTIGKTVTFSAWRGVNYARQRVVGANPRTTGQTLTRATFAMLRELWKRFPALARAPWDAFAAGRPFTGVNAEVGENVRVLRGEADMALYIGSPGAKGGLGVAATTAVAGAATGAVDATLTPPVLPTGWTITRAVFYAMPDQAPDLDFVGPMVIVEDLVSPYTAAITGFASAQDVIVSAWLEYVKPNGEVAYSPSITKQATAGA